MIVIPAGVKVHMALGYTDMREAVNGTGKLIQELLKKDPSPGHLLAFRGNASLSEILFRYRTGLITEALAARCGGE